MFSNTTRRIRELSLDMYSIALESLNKIIKKIKYARPTQLKRLELYLPVKKSKGQASQGMLPLYRLFRYFTVIAFR